MLYINIFNISSLTFFYNKQTNLQLTVPTPHYCLFLCIVFRSLLITEPERATVPLNVYQRHIVDRPIYIKHFKQLRYVSHQLSVSFTCTTLF